MEMPYLHPSLSISQKDFWIQAYLAALHRVGPRDAIADADAALALCNERWDQRNIRPVVSCQFPHNYPIGAFPVSRDE